VLDVGTSGKVHVIFPNEFQHENKVAAQEVVQIPPEDGRFQFRVKGPAGREVLKVFATERPLECLDPQRLAKSGPYYEVPGEPKAIARDISVELKRNLKAIYGVATRFVTIRANGAKSSTLDQRRLPSSAETPEHLFELGEASLYDDRQASLRDARRYYEQAAGHGHVLSMVRLGEIYEGGLGTEPDAVKALHWYRTAAELGSAAAMVKLGHMYELGLGVEASPAEALNWLSKAAKAGDGVAMARLARAYDEGKGVEQNAREAARYALAAVRAGVWSPQRDIPRFNEETRVEVQRQLRNAGFYHGRLDGTFGPETRAALVEYARAEHVAG
jgi:TPR repeat protein